MSLQSSKRILGTTLLIVLYCAQASAQTQEQFWEAWPSVKANFELRSRMRLQLFGELENGEEFPFLQWKAGALFNYRMKRILRLRQADIDEEHDHALVVGGGYEFLDTAQGDKKKREHRIIFQATPRYVPGADISISDRNQVEFRWVNGVYDVRYRNRLTVDRPFKLNGFRFTPYTSGELFYDRNHHSWNENRYAFGVQLPYKKRLMVDTFYLRQNCTTCSQNPLNVWGITLNLYFRRKG
jgi:Protein of unknown function (DUF2490)